VIAENEGPQAGDTIPLGGFSGPATVMDTRPCGRQGLELTAQGLGCMSLTTGADTNPVLKRNLHLLPETQHSRQLDARHPTSDCLAQVTVSSWQVLCLVTLMLSVQSPWWAML